MMWQPSCKLLAHPVNEEAVCYFRGDNAKAKPSSLMLVDGMRFLFVRLWPGCPSKSLGDPRVSASALRLSSVREARKFGFSVQHKPRSWQTFEACFGKAMSHSKLCARNAKSEEISKAGKNVCMRQATDIHCASHGN